MIGDTLSGVDIICLALRTWDSPWKNNQQIMSRLARANRVLYIGPPHTLREGVRALRLGHPTRPVLESIGDGLFVYREPRILARTPHSRVYNWVSERLRLAQSRRLAARLGFSRPILWVYDPMSVDAVGTFGERFIVYHVIDNYNEYYPTSQPRLRDAIGMNHVRMLRSADVVFTVSESLRATCEAYNPHCYHVPNGVPYDEFQAALAGGAVPSDVGAIRRPIVGYIGVMQSALDFDLLQEVARRRPEWSVMLVGPEEHLGEQEAFIALRSLPNVHYLGPKELAHVPSYMKACDVALLPYRISEATAQGDSIKLYEYLACGRPVVSTDIPSARQFTPIVRIAQGPGAFVEAIDAALADAGTGEHERVAMVREHSWDRRVSQIGTIVAGHLGHSDAMRPHRTPVGAVS